MSLQTDCEAAYNSSHCPNRFLSTSCPSPRTGCVLFLKHYYGLAPRCYHKPVTLGAIRLRFTIISFFATVYHYHATVNVNIAILAEPAMHRSRTRTRRPCLFQGVSFLQGVASDLSFCYSSTDKNSSSRVTVRPSGAILQN